MTSEIFGETNILILGALVPAGKKDDNDVSLPRQVDPITGAVGDSQL